MYVVGTYRKLDDEARRAALFAGDLFVYPPLPASAALAHLDPDELAGSEAAALEAARLVVGGLGCDPQETYLTPPALVGPPRGSEAAPTAGAGRSSGGRRRRVWTCQVSWKLLVGGGPRDRPFELERRTDLVLRPTESERARQVIVAYEPGTVVLSAPGHARLALATGPGMAARVVEFRTVNALDLVEGRGALCPQAALEGIAIDEFLRAEDYCPIPAAALRRYRLVSTQPSSSPRQRPPRSPAQGRSAPAWDSA